ncbi:hypothetical protein [Sagittula sp. MA-2]|jgi:hypothetical protein|uniref:hypothetical protein n=1 Tax=Sagittula sp. MA-2 TaxID=3048007 RepID=UPI0024C339D8|nr:hypothetical protein [Sagittula sp. MA-2]WHZ36536.1 hypothetical protein QNI11_05860 [Sagittula sp. MA-2]
MSEIDPDREVEEFVYSAVNGGARLWRLIEARQTTKPKPAKNFDEAFGGYAITAADVARDRSASQDPMARDLLAWEAFAWSQHRAVAFIPGATKLPGAPTRKQAAARVKGFAMLRRAYEAETGRSARTGTRLTQEQRELRRQGLRPEWLEEARGMMKQPVDSAAWQNARDLEAKTRRVAEARLSSRVIRKTPAQMCR